MNKPNYNILTPFKRWTIQNFPFIEEDFDAITNYQLLCKIVEYLNKVIENEKELEKVNNELIDAFNNLKLYVDNYFENLDIQDEIDNKLDEMAESGQLTDIIAQYLGLAGILVYNTLSDLKNAENLVNGSIAMTLGYHSIGDGGSAKYKIRQIINTDDPNDMDLIALTNDVNLVAEIVLDNTEIIVNQFGAYGDGTHDDTNAIQYAIDYTRNKKLIVKFLSQTYLTTSPLTLYECTKLEGNYLNDEYDKNTTIYNITSDLVELENDTVGIHINNILFKGSESTDYYFVNDNTHAFKWCEFNNVSFRNFKKVFNIAILGCRFNNVFINHVKSAGTFTGSDNTFTDWFIGTPFANMSDDAMILHSLTLSRFTNLYFTGKTANDNGCNNILKFENGYCSNLSFNGCYFDFSNGSALDIIGSGANFPDSGATNISFNNCLFRGNCCDQNTVTHVINANYCRNLNIINCSFMTNNRYTVNSDSKIYNLGEFTQGVFLSNNLYLTPFSANGSYINNASIFEPYSPSKINNFGIKNYNNTTFLSCNVTDNIKIFKKVDTYTTGATYGEITVYFPESLGDNPIVTASVVGGGYVACVNALTSSSVQFIIRQASNGNPILNTSVKLSVIAFNK